MGAMVTTLGLAAGCVVAPVDDASESVTDELASCPHKGDMKTYDAPDSWVKRAQPQDCTCVSSRYDCMPPNPQPRIDDNANRARFLNPKRDVPSGDPKSYLNGTWPLAVGVGVFDGFRQRIGTTAQNYALVNFGQKKRMGGRTYVFVKVVTIAEGGGAPGWIDAQCIGWDGVTAPPSSCETTNAQADVPAPAVPARRPSVANQKKYTRMVFRADPAKAIAALGVDPEAAKVVCDWHTEDGGVRANGAIGDYLPKPRANGKFTTVHLNFDLPGRVPALSGVAADTFIVGHQDDGAIVSDHVSFYVLHGVRAVPVQLYKGASAESYPVKDPAVPFVYGFVKYQGTKDGAERTLTRFGWVPLAALEVP